MKTELKAAGAAAKCPKCGHEWITRKVGGADKCPRCQGRRK